MLFFCWRTLIMIYEYLILNGLIVSHHKKMPVLSVMQCKCNKACSACFTAIFIIIFDDTGNLHYLYLAISTNFE